MARFSSERGVPFSNDEVELLWHLGLLRADIVFSNRRLRRSGLSYLGAESKHHAYSDLRKPQIRGSHQRGVSSKRRPLSSVVQPLFHSLSGFYELYHLNRILDFGVAPRQALYRAEYYHQLLDGHLRAVYAWLRSRDGLGAIDRWNWLCFSSYGD